MTKIREMLERLRETVAPLVPYVPRMDALKQINTILAALPVEPVAGLEELIERYHNYATGTLFVSRSRWILDTLIPDLRALAAKQEQPQPPVVLCSCGLPAMNSEEGKPLCGPCLNALNAKQEQPPPPPLPRELVERAKRVIAIVNAKGEPFFNDADRAAIMSRLEGGALPSVIREVLKDSLAGYKPESEDYKTIKAFIEGGAK